MRNPSWRDRQQALPSELENSKLSSPGVQHKIIEIFEQETADPNWAELAEGQDYEDYYGNLMQLCQKDCGNYGSPAAWRALIYSAYDIDSPFGKWLIAQPQAFSLYLAMLDSGKNGESGLAKEALAGMLARCTVPNAPNCSSVLARRDELMRVIRSELFPSQFANGQGKPALNPQLTSDSVLSSIQALSVCGFQEDLLLLEKLANQYASKKFYQADSPAAEDQRAVLWLIHNAEQKIKDRTVAH